MKILAVEQEICKARDGFEKAVRWISVAVEDGLRADQAEREIFAQLIQLGHSLLSAFLKQAADGDEGQRIEHGGQTLKRSVAKKSRPSRSIFGVIEVERYVYVRRMKQKAEYLTVDQILGLPKASEAVPVQEANAAAAKEPLPPTTLGFTPELS